MFMRIVNFFVNPTIEKREKKLTATQQHIYVLNTKKDHLMDKTTCTLQQQKNYNKFIMLEKPVTYCTKEINNKQPYMKLWPMPHLRILVAAFRGPTQNCG